MTPRRGKAESPQLSLFAGAGDVTIERTSGNWPDPARFPHNEGGSQVGQTLLADLAQSADILMVTGFASLERLIEFLAKRSPDEGQNRLLIGHEPFVHPGRRRLGTRARPDDDLRDYWLERNVSITLCWPILQVLALLDAGRLDVRIGPPGKPIHAKMFLSDDATVMGSSNFSTAGMKTNSEANVRFTADTEPERYAECVQMAEGLWRQSLDYTDDFRHLLNDLLRQVTWQEALARACACLLEGDWAKGCLPTGFMATAFAALWPHQREGIVRALWTLETMGSVLIADAAGSGKTRLGAWLLRALHDRQYRLGHGFSAAPLMIAPPAMVEQWQDSLRETSLGWQAFSQGVLSHAKAADHDRLTAAVQNTPLLAVDEAHNFLNQSGRTRLLLSHFAEHAVLFTATPINRQASDLLALVELLGADNLSDRARDRLAQLWKRRNPEQGLTEPETAALRQEIGTFMLRRTRRELDRIARANPEAYRLDPRRSARYPRHEAAFYPLPSPPADLDIARQIEVLSQELLGVISLRLFKLPRSFELQGWSERSFVRMRLHSAKALARSHVMECLRSSTAALFEHVHGTAAAWACFADDGHGAAVKDPTGNMAQKLTDMRTSLPHWQLGEEARAEAPAWLFDHDAYAQACMAEADRYRKIAELACQLSDAREKAKLRHLIMLRDREPLIIAFDSHVITLNLFARMLRERQLPAHVFSGEGGAGAKREAVALLGAGSETRGVIALCSDALSEGMNLQGASCVVHLDTPTVIRIAEQRAGRVDRMDSRHDVVSIWWPKDDPAFTPRKRDLLMERHEMVSGLIGANLQLPSDDDNAPDEDAAVDVTELAAQAAIDQDELQNDFFDALQPVKSLIGANGLISERQYDEMRTSQAKVISCVSIVPSTSVWAFIAIDTVGSRSALRHAPRWVVFRSPHAEPETDLRAVVDVLQSRLLPDMPTLDLTEAHGTLIEQFLAKLTARGMALLPARRRRAIKLLEDTLSHYRRQADLDGDWERLQTIGEIGRLLMVDGSDRPDLAIVADRWLELLRPFAQDALRMRRGRRALWSFLELKKPLRDRPIPTRSLMEAFADIPTLPPLEQRIAAMIVGAPGPT